MHVKPPLKKTGTTGTFGTKRRVGPCLLFYLTTSSPRPFMHDTHGSIPRC